MHKGHKLTKKLRTTISQIRKGEFAYKEKDPAKVDFTKYNTAQINEIADVLDAIRDIVDLANQRIQEKASSDKGPGRPSTPISDVVKVQLLESYFGVSDRVSEGFLRLFREKLDIFRFLLQDHRTWLQPRTQ